MQARPPAAYAAPSEPLARAVELGHTASMAMIVLNVTALKVIGVFAVTGGLAAAVHALGR